MGKLLLFFFVFGSILSSTAQSLGYEQFQNLQLLENNLVKAKTAEQKTNALVSLYIYHASHSEAVNKKAATDYQQQLEIFTHQNNDPELTARALYNLVFSSRGDEFKKRVSRLYQFAKLHNLEFYKAVAKIGESQYYTSYQPDQNKAAQLLNDAVNLTKNLNDSLRIAIFIGIGFRQNDMNNYLQALQYAFQAYELASKINSADLMRRSNNLLASIYRQLEDYNKAIEYNLKELPLLKLLNQPHFMAARHASVARYFFLSNQPVLGNYHVKEAYRLADSVKGSKRLYNDITGMTVTALNISNQKELLDEFLRKYRQYFFIFPGSEFLDNVTLASAYIKTGNIDSARLLINKAKGYMSGNQTAAIRKAYYNTLAWIASYDNNFKTAVENYKQSLQLSLAQNDLTESIGLTDSLKNILVKQNILREAVHYYNFGDSLQNELNKQLDKQDITRQEVAALEKEKEMQALAKEKEKNQRHNVQYLGITFGVVALFVSLLLMGIFKVSPRMIKILSFFSFLLFFEFIFLIFKKQIAVFTHGEPWKDLAFMVLLAAVMVPLHHWSEHKVIDYLSTRKISFRKTKLPLTKPLSHHEVVN